MGRSKNTICGPACKCKLVVWVQVVFESRPDKPTRPADVAHPAVSVSPPPAPVALRTSSVAEDNPGRDVVDDSSPPPTALTRPAAPGLAIPPLPPRRGEVRCHKHKQLQPVPGRPADLRLSCSCCSHAKSCWVSAVPHLAFPFHRALALVLMRRYVAVRVSCSETMTWVTAARLHLLACPHRQWCVSFSPAMCRLWL
jgi:hypothetical protein